nr:hypothetical protein CFP56_72095 [Quercus suber]
MCKIGKYFALRVTRVPNDSRDRYCYDSFRLMKASFGSDSAVRSAQDHLGLEFRFKSCSDWPAAITHSQITSNYAGRLTIISPNFRGNQVVIGLQ